MEMLYIHACFDRRWHDCVDGRYRRATRTCFIFSFFSVWLIVVYTSVFKTGAPEKTEPAVAIKWVQNGLSIY